MSLSISPFIYWIQIPSLPRTLYYSRHVFEPLCALCLWISANKIILLRLNLMNVTSYEDEKVKSNYIILWELRMRYNYKIIKNIKKLNIKIIYIISKNKIWNYLYFQASPSSHSIVYVGSCKPIVNILTSSAGLFGLPCRPAWAVERWRFESLTEEMSLYTWSPRPVITSWAGIGERLILVFRSLQVCKYLKQP